MPLRLPIQMGRCLVLRGGGGTSSPAPGVLQTKESRDRGDANDSHYKAFALAPADTSLAVYMAHRADLLKYADSIVRDRASAEDLVQEAWLRFSSATAQAADISHPTSYLYSIVRNLARDWLRRTASSLASPSTPEVIDTIPSDAPSVERVLYYRDELRVFDEVLSELPERTQRALILYRYEKRTLQEVANELGVSVARVHSMVKQAMMFCALRIKGPEG